MQSPSVENAEEGNAMTFQIGLVGSDGSVIASDTFLQQTEYGARSVGTISKFLSGQGVLCCWSGDSVAQHAASIVCGLNWPGIPPDKGSIEEELKARWRQSVG
jgi:hypothetical protein